MKKQIIDLQNNYYHSGAISDSGKDFFLCGSGVKQYSIEQCLYVQTISKLRNALITLAHSQDRLCIANAARGNVTLIEYKKEGSLFLEKQRMTINAYNTDGGNPIYSSDDKCLYFATQFKTLWRYSFETQLCKRFYQVEYPDQTLSFDLYEDQLLITLGSSSDDRHCGFDVLDMDGRRLTSMRYGDEDNKLVSCIFRAKWLNTKTIIVIYPSSIYSLEDKVQLIDAFDTKRLCYCPNRSLEKMQKTLWDFKTSPNRQYGVFVWMNWPDLSFTVSILSLTDMKLIYEAKVDHIHDLSISNNSQYLFICADQYLCIDLDYPNLSHMLNQ